MGGRGFLQDGVIRGPLKVQCPLLPMDLSLFRMGLQGVKLLKPRCEEEGGSCR